MAMGPLCFRFPFIRHQNFHQFSIILWFIHLFFWLFSRRVQATKRANLRKAKLEYEDYVDRIRVINAEIFDVRTGLLHANIRQYFLSPFPSMFPLSTFEITLHIFFFFRFFLGTAFADDLCQVLPIDVDVLAKLKLAEDRLRRINDVEAAILNDFQGEREEEVALSELLGKEPTTLSGTDRIPSNEIRRDVRGNLEMLKKERTVRETAFAKVSSSISLLYPFQI